MTGNNIGFKRMDHLYRSYRASSIARMLADRVQSAEGILRNRLEIETGNPELWDVYSNKRRIKKRFKEHDRGGRPFERTGAMLVGDIRDIESDYEWSPFGDELLLPDDEGPWRPFGVMSCGVVDFSKFNDQKVELLDLCPDLNLASRIGFFSSWVTIGQVPKWQVDAVVDGAVKYYQYANNGKGRYDAIFAFSRRDDVLQTYGSVKRSSVDGPWTGFRANDLLGFGGNDPNELFRLV